MGMFKAIDQAIEEKFPNKEKQNEIKSNLKDFLSEKITAEQVLPELYELLREIDAKFENRIEKASQE